MEPEGEWKDIDVAFSKMHSRSGSEFLLMNQSFSRKFLGAVLTERCKNYVTLPRVFETTENWSRVASALPAEGRRGDEEMAVHGRTGRLRAAPG